MPYDPNPSSALTYRNDNLQDWQNALPGQWFIGVVDTHNKNIYIVPVNVFEGRGALNPNVLNNTDQRGMNRFGSGATRYAAGAAAAREKQIDPEDQNTQVPIERQGVVQNFVSFAGGNFIETRPAGRTHHTCVAQNYGANPDDCLGFSLIKLAPTTFAMMKCGSNSLNLHPNYTVNYNFSVATATSHNADFNPAACVTAYQMPDGWVDAVIQFLAGNPYNLTRIAKSND